LALNGENDYYSFSNEKYIARENRAEEEFTALQKN
jgi:hypothetical protein